MLNRGNVIGNSWERECARKEAETKRNPPLLNVTLGRTSYWQFRSGGNFWFECVNFEICPKPGIWGRFWFFWSGFSPISLLKGLRGHNFPNKFCGVSLVLWRRLFSLHVLDCWIFKTGMYKVVRWMINVEHSTLHLILHAKIERT